MPDSVSAPVMVTSTVSLKNSPKVILFINCLNELLFALISPVGADASTVLGISEPDIVFALQPRQYVSPVNPTAVYVGSIFPLTSVSPK